MEYKITCLESVSSTNTCLADMLRQSSVPEGTVVIAREQTSGRGLGSNMWESEAGMNLTFSLLLYPSFLAVSEQFMLTKVFSLALTDYLHTFLGIGEVRIKWPNDIYCGMKKIAGILVENNISGDSLISTIAGIGLNVNQELFRSEAPNPVSIRNIIKSETNLQHALNSLLQCIEKRYLQLKYGERALLNLDYKHSLLFLHEERKYRSPGATFNGSIEGVDAYGRLMMRIADGKEKLFERKEVSFII